MKTDKGARSNLRGNLGVFLGVITFSSLGPRSLYVGVTRLERVYEQADKTDLDGWAILGCEPSHLLSY